VKERKEKRIKRENEEKREWFSLDDD